MAVDCGLGFVLVALFPVWLPAIVSPSYFAPLLRNGTGLLMLAAMVALTTLGSGSIVLIILRNDRRLRRGDARQAARILLLLLVPTVLLLLPGDSIALLGPAIIVVSGQ